MRVLRYKYNDGKSPLEWRELSRSIYCKNKKYFYIHWNTICFSKICRSVPFVNGRTLYFEIYVGN